MARIPKEQIKWMVADLDNALENAVLGALYFIELRLGDRLSGGEIDEIYMKVFDSIRSIHAEATEVLRERLSGDVSWRDIKGLINELGIYFGREVEEIFNILGKTLKNWEGIDLKEVENGIMSYVYLEYYSLAARLYELYVDIAEAMSG